MSSSTDAAVTPPVNNPSARRRQTTTALVLTTLLTAFLAFSPFRPAKAWSENCMDGWPGVTMQLVEGDFGLPLWLGFESYVLDGQPGHVALCYGTGAPGDAKTAGGMTSVAVTPGPNGASVGYTSASDANSANQVNASANASPTYALSTGGTSGVNALTVSIPFTVCSGPCQPVTQPADGPSGVIMGTISQTSTQPGGTSAAYGVTGLCVQVDGNTVLGNCTSRIGDAGVTTTGTRPDTWTGYSPGPCVAGICGWTYSTTGTTGNQLATVYVPGLGAIPVYGVHTCLYQEDPSSPCDP